MKYKILLSLVVFSVAAISGSVQAVGNADAGKTKAQVCFSCHGMNGDGNTNPPWPALAGQHASYISKQLTDFKSGARMEPLMIAQVANLSEQDITDIAAFFSSQKVKQGTADKAKAELGGKIYRGGNKATKVAACMACHGPSGAGNPGAKFPSLSGQNSAYVVKAMNDFRSAARTNDAGKMMQGVAKSMTDAEIEAVASFVSGLH